LVVQNYNIAVVYDTVMLECIQRLSDSRNQEHCVYGASITYVGWDCVMAYDDVGDLSDYITLKF